MKLRLREMKSLQAVLLCLLITWSVVSFDVFAFLQIVSYLVLGLCILGFLVMFCLCLQRPAMSRLDALVSTYFMVLIILTLLNGTAIKDVIYMSITVFLLLMTLNYFSSNFDVTLKVCAVAFSAIVYANLIIMMMFPDWMFEAEDTFYSYLLGGNYNQMGGRMLCGIITNILCLRFSRAWLINIIPLIVVSVLTVLLVGSMTSAFCMLLFILFCLVPSKKMQKIGIVAFFVFYLLFQFIVCFSGEGLQNNPIAVYIVEDILGKDMSFTYRTTMWDAAGKLFAESPLWGYGWVDNDWYLANLSSLAKGPHNFIYSILINGGLILAALFVWICYETWKMVSCSRLDRLYVILIFSIQTWLFMGTMEVYPIFFFVYLIMLAYYYPTLKINDGNHKETQTVNSNARVQQSAVGKGYD